MIVWKELNHNRPTYEVGQRDQNMAEYKPQYSEAEQSEAEKFNASRQENENRWEDLANERNENRSLIKKVLKKDIVSAGEVMHEEALRENEQREEEIAGALAMEKVVDISDKKIVLHLAPPSKVEKILHQGILSRAFMRRATELKAAEIDTNYTWALLTDTVHFQKADYNIDHDAYIHAFLADGGGGTHGEVSTLGIVIDKTKLVGRITKWGPGDWSVKRRIRPEAIVGFGLSHSGMFYETEKVQTMKPGKWMVLPSEKVSKEKIKGITAVARKYKLPVYGYAGDLVWPQSMTREQVKQFVAERDKQKVEKEHETE